MVRTLLNYFNSIPNSQQTQIDVLTHSIQWSKHESNLKHCSTLRVASTVALPEGLTSLLSVKPGEPQIGFDNLVLWLCRGLDRVFYKAILSVHQNQFPQALKEICKARELLDPELISFVGEGYGRSYNTLVRAQMLSELDIHGAPELSLAR
ncbi:FAT domain-containing protein [Suillus placidus]|uniref:FAT domain-containing protein n=1 Tax=Suillus placidus TaxID=48579 RepID=A0A9P7CW87_9AGAM|nr:FAT domain-containing protein [Suillus placidus]